MVISAQRPVLSAPADLYRAHGVPDRTADRLCRRWGFGSDREGVERLWFV